MWIVAAAMRAVSIGLAVAVPETAPAVVSGRRGGGRLFHPAAVFPGVLLFTGATGMAAFFAFLPLHAEQVGLDGAGLPFAIFAVLVVALRIRFLKLPDTMGAARLSSLALGGSAVGMAILSLVSSPLGVFAGSIVFAIGVAFLAAD